MNLDNYDTRKGSDAGATVELVSPVDGKGLGAYLSILGVDGAAYAEAQSELVEAALKTKASRLTPDQERRLLVACVTGWRDEEGEALEFGGARHPFSVPAALKFFEQFPRFATQVEAAIRNLGNFLPT